MILSKNVMCNSHSFDGKSLIKYEWNRMNKTKIRKVSLLQTESEKKNSLHSSLTLFDVKWAIL